MPNQNSTQHPGGAARVPLTFTRSLVVAWLDSGQPDELPAHLREWIGARVAKVLAMYEGSDIDGQDLATMGVADGLDTDWYTAQKLRRLAIPLSRDEQIALLDIAGLRTATGGQSGLRVVQAALPLLSALGYAMVSSGRWCTTVPGQHRAKEILRTHDEVSRLIRATDDCEQCQDCEACTTACSAFRTANL